VTWHTEFLSTLDLSRNAKLSQIDLKGQISTSRREERLSDLFRREGEKKVPDKDISLTFLADPVQ